jgi:hypothetical protein
VPRTRSLLAIAALLLAAPAAASASPGDVPITVFKAGPVTAFNTGTGFPVSLTSAPTASNTDLNCTPSNVALSTQAGATTDYCISFATNPGDVGNGGDIHDTLVQLPVGTLASIDLAAKCTEAQFNRDSPTLAANTCPGASQVGTALAQIIQPTGPGTQATTPAPGRIYALDTPDGKAAKFGVALLASATAPYPETKFEITVSQLGDPAIGLQNQTDTLAKTVPSASYPGGKAPIAIAGTSLRFWGSASAHVHAASPLTGNNTPTTMAADFFRVGTTCQTDQTVSLTVNPYTDVDPAATPSNATTTYKLTGCDALPFNPTFSAGLTGDTSPGAHPGLDINITVPEGDEDLGGTKITTPIGIATDLTRVQNPCPLATFQAGTCGDATIVGTVKATLSGINADVVTGNVQQVKIEGQTLPALGLDFKGRLPLRIVGQTTIDPASRLVNSFINTPSIPQRSLSISLYGGDKGILQLPKSSACTRSAYEAIITGQNGKTKSFYQGTVCPEQLTARLDNGSKTRPTLNVSGSLATGKKASSIRITLPKGLTIAKNKSQSGLKFDKFEAAVTGKPTKARINASQFRFSIPKPGSNVFRILTKTNTLVATKTFAKSKAAVTVDARIVYLDGSKATIKIPLTRK